MSPSLPNAASSPLCVTWGLPRSLSFPIIWGTGLPSVVLSAEDLGLGAVGAGPASQAWM